MEEPNNDIDTETLQAQIDLAMAETQNLIASWLPGSSSSGSLTQSSSRTAEAEAELQALLRRPPRLGVGAPLPETHAPAQARLVQKLQQGTKKRENGAVGAKKKGDGDDEESSAEESRIGTARKRTIVDPFEVAGKKKKRRRKDAEEKAEAPYETAEAGRQTVDESMTDAFEGPTTTTTPKKKKRKKKSHLPQIQETEEATHTHNAVVAHILEGDKDGDSEAEAMDTDLDAVPGSGEGPSLPVQRSPTGAISTGNARLPVPHILNLTGPPSMTPEGTEGHTRKKRKRKRKKKKPAGDPP